MKYIDAGKCVRKAQNLSGVCNTELASKVGTSPQQVIRFRNQKNMKVHTMQKICSALNISIEDFITFGY